MEASFCHICVTPLPLFPSSLSAVELFGISVTLVELSDGPLSLFVSVALSSDIGLSVVGCSDGSVAFSSDIGLSVVGCSDGSVAFSSGIRLSMIVLLSPSSGELSQEILLLPSVGNTKTIS